MRAYLSRLSGPLLDRIDLHVEVGRVATDELLSDRPPAENESGHVQARVVAARERAEHRFAEEPGVFANAQLGARQVRRHCRLTGSTRALLRTAAERLGLTARALDRVRKVGRTIADLDGAAEIGEAHLAEALQYRGFDRAWLASQE